MDAAIAVMNPHTDAKRSITDSSASSANVSVYSVPISCHTTQNKFKTPRLLARLSWFPCTIMTMRTI